MSNVNKNFRKRLIKNHRGLPVGYNNRNRLAHDLNSATVMKLLQNDMHYALLKHMFLSARINKAQKEKLLENLIHRAVNLARQQRRQPRRKTT